MRSGFRTDRTDRTDTEMEETPLNNKIYFSNSSLNEAHHDETRDGLLINEFPNASRIDYMAKKKTRPLKLRKKLYEFYAAPISKYVCHSMAYAIFLAVYTYICLGKFFHNNYTEIGLSYFWFYEARKIE